MNYVWEVDTEEQPSGVTRTLVCTGEMFRLEIQEQDSGIVIGTVWRRTPATFWEPEDVECIHEVEYESTTHAKVILQNIDYQEALDQARIEKDIDEAYEELKKLEG